jgi:hypothetical protein
MDEAPFIEYVSQSRPRADAELIEQAPYILKASPKGEGFHPPRGETMKGASSESSSSSSSPSASDRFEISHELGQASLEQMVRLPAQLLAHRRQRSFDNSARRSQHV